MELLSSASLVFIGIFINGGNTFWQARQILRRVFPCRIRAERHSLKSGDVAAGYKKASRSEENAIVKIARRNASVVFRRLIQKRTIKGSTVQCPTAGV